MLAVGIIAMFALGGASQAALVKVWEAKAGQIYSFHPGPRDSEHFVVDAVIEGQRRWPLRFDPKSKSFRILAEGRYYPQNPANGVLVYVLRDVRTGGWPAPYTLSVYRITDGALLAEHVMEEEYYVPSVHGRQVVMTRNNAPALEIDGITGDPLPPMPERKRYGVIWDSPKRRLMVEYGRPFPDADYLVEAEPSTYKVIRRVALNGGAWPVEGLLGNPDNGPFAIEQNFVGVGTETFLFTAFTKELKPSPVGGGADYYMYDVGPLGILGSPNRGYPPPESGDRFPELQRVDVATGKILWRKKEFANSRARWMGAYAVALKGNALHLLDGRDGRLISKVEVPQGAKILGVQGKTLLIHEYYSGIVQGWRVVDDAGA